MDEGNAVRWNCDTRRRSSLSLLKISDYCLFVGRLQKVFAAYCLYHWFILNHKLFFFPDETNDLFITFQCSNHIIWFALDSAISTDINLNLLEGQLAIFHQDSIIFSSDYDDIGQCNRKPHMSCHYLSRTMPFNINTRSFCDIKNSC